MHVKITAGFGPEARSLVVRDRKCEPDSSEAIRGEVIDLDDASIRMLTAMLAGDPLVLKNGFLFEDGNRRFYLYGQRLTDVECDTAMLLLTAGLIRPMMGGPSPALTQQSVNEYGFHVAKEIRAFRTEVYDLA